MNSVMDTNRNNESRCMTKWAVYFCVLYFILMIPTPFTYTKEIYLGPLGIPLFVWAWAIDNILVILSMFVFYAEAKRRGLIED